MECGESRKNQQDSQDRVQDMELPQTQILCNVGMNLCLGIFRCHVMKDGVGECIGLGRIHAELGPLGLKRLQFQKVSCGLFLRREIGTLLFNKVKGLFQPHQFRFCGLPQPECFLDCCLCHSGAVIFQLGDLVQ